jgi:protein TonB
MASLAVDRSFECMPHASRSLAWVLALSFNLALVLYALLPSAPLEMRVLPPQSLLATVLQAPPPVVQPPAVPTLRVAQHVTAPSVHLAVPRTTRIALPALPAIAPVTQVQATATHSGAEVSGMAGRSEATIAYETASPPVYPLQALRAGVQGTVLLKVLVDRSGKPVKVMIARSSGSRLLDNAARAHVLAAWRFHPALRDGRTIEAWALVPVKFNLGNF